MINAYTKEWKDWKGMACACGIRIYAGVGEASGKTVVIATDLNIGVSVTNQAGEIATMICRDENIAPENLILIENYNHEPRSKPGVKSIRDDQTYDLVLLNWNEIQQKFSVNDWRHSTKEKTEA